MQRPDLYRELNFAEHRHLDPVSDPRAAGFSLLETAILFIAAIALSVAFMWLLFNAEAEILARTGR